MAYNSRQIRQRRRRLFDTLLGELASLLWRTHRHSIDAIRHLTGLFPTRSECITSKEARASGFDLRARGTDQIFDAARAEGAIQPLMGVAVCEYMPTRRHRACEPAGTRLRVPEKRRTSPTPASLVSAVHNLHVLSARLRIRPLIADQGRTCQGVREDLSVPSAIVDNQFGFQVCGEQTWGDPT
jgi:hypothetical protein